MRFILFLVFSTFLFADSVPSHPANRVLQRGDLVCSVTSYNEIVRSEVLESEEQQSTGCFLNLYDNGTSSASCITSTSCPDQSNGSDYGGYYGTGGYENTVQRYCYQVDTYKSTVDWCCSADSYINETCNESSNNNQNNNVGNSTTDNSNSLDDQSDTIDSGNESDTNEDTFNSTTNDSSDYSDYSNDDLQSNSTSDTSDGGSNQDVNNSILDELKAIHEAIGDSVDVSPLENLDSSIFDDLNQFVDNFKSDMVSMGRDFEDLKNMFKNGFDPNKYNISTGCSPKFSIQLFGQDIEINFCPAMSAIRPIFTFIFTLIFLILSLRILFIGIKYDR